MNQEVISKIYREIKDKNLNQIQSLILENMDSDFLYYLSDKRQNVLSVIDFNDDDEVLEISFDCGNLTSKYIDEIKDATILVSSYEQKQINMIMNNGNKKVNYLDINDITLINKQYSKIILCGCISGLESKMKQLKRLLKKDGEFILILNNKYSIRYFAGIKEENSSTFFSTIEGDELYSASQIRMRVNKLKMKCKFFYPIPDYSFSSEVYSEDYLPAAGSLKNISISLKDERYVLFDDSKALNEALKSNDFETFAPSFLVKVR